MSQENKSEPGSGTYSHVQYQVLITCHHDGYQQLRKILANKQIKVQQEWPEIALLQVRLTKNQIDAIQDSEFIESIEIDESVTIQE